LISLADCIIIYTEDEGRKIIMNKPKFFYYPIVDADEVSKYLSEFYGEKIDVIDILFGWEVSNYTYVDYPIEKPREEYHGEEWESLEHWEKRKKIETYIFNEFIDWDMILFKICW
jgi:hypothetical protein